MELTKMLGKMVFASETHEALTVAAWLGAIHSRREVDWFLVSAQISYPTERAFTIFVQADKPLGWPRWVATRVSLSVMVTWLMGKVWGWSWGWGWSGNVPLCSCWWSGAGGKGSHGLAIKDILLIGRGGVAFRPPLRRATWLVLAGSIIFIWTRGWVTWLDGVVVCWRCAVWCGDG